MSTPPDAAPVGAKYEVQEPRFLVLLQMRHTVLRTGRREERWADALLREVVAPSAASALALVQVREEIDQVIQNEAAVRVWRVLVARIEEAQIISPKWLWEQEL